MARNIIIAPGEFYHIYNRGTDKRKIFLLREDYERFLSLLYLSNNVDPVRIDNIRHLKSQQGLTLLEAALKSKRNQLLIDIGAYCLMPNHFHLIARERVDGGMSRFMQKLTTAYTMYFNIRHERNGALFQGTFKATHAKDDRYLSYVLAYIHLNPIKLIDPKWKENGISNQRKAKSYLERYTFSSYLDYIGKKRIQNVIINENALPDYGNSVKDFRQNTLAWLQYEKENTSDARRVAVTTARLNLT
jgi:putative transposase